MHNGHEFMKVISISNPIREIMEGVGYTPEVHRQVWELYSALRYMDKPWSKETLALPRKQALEALHKYFKDIVPRARAARPDRVAPRNSTRRAFSRDIQVEFCYNSLHEKAPIQSGDPGGAPAPLRMLGQPRSLRRPYRRSRR